jgi:hypothetical protein
VEDARPARRGEVSGESLGLALAGDDHRDRPSEILGERGQQDRGQRADSARDDEAVLSLPDALEEVRVSGDVSSQIPEHRQNPYGGRAAEGPTDLAAGRKEVLASFGPSA